MFQIITDNSNRFETNNSEYYKIIMCKLQYELNLYDDIPKFFISVLCQNKITLEDVHHAGVIGTSSVLILHKSPK